MPCAYRVREYQLPPQFTVRWANNSDREALVQQTVLTEDRLKVGDRTAIVTEGDRLIGTVWIATQVYHDRDTALTIDLLPNEGWLYGAWIHRDCRGQHVYSHLIAHICESLQQQSVDSLLLAVDWSNGLSQKVHQAFGAERIGSLYGLRICGARHYSLHC